MSAFLDAAKAYTSERRTLEKVHVPELDQDIYFFKEMTLAEHREIYPYFANPEGVDLEGFIVFLITRARDEDGKRLFTKAHRPELRRISSDLLARIVNAMRAAGPDLEDFEDAEKN